LPPERLPRDPPDWIGERILEVSVGDIEGFGAEVAHQRLSGLRLGEKSE